MTNDLLIDEDHIPDTHMRRRRAADGKPLAPIYAEESGSLADAVDEALLHRIKAFSYAGRSYVRVGWTWWLIRKPLQRRAQP